MFLKYLRYILKDVDITVNKKKEHLKTQKCYLNTLLRSAFALKKLMKTFYKIMINQNKFRCNFKPICFYLQNALIMDKLLRRYFQS